MSHNKNLLDSDYAMTRTIILRISCLYVDRIAVAIVSNSYPIATVIATVCDVLCFSERSLYRWNSNHRVTPSQADSRWLEN